MLDVPLMEDRCLHVHSCGEPVDVTSVRLASGQIGGVAHWPLRVGTVLW